MTMGSIANEDMQVSFDNSAGPPDLIYQGDLPADGTKIKPMYSAKCNVEGKKVAVGSVAVTFSAATPCPHTSASHTFVAGFSNVAATAEYVSAGGMPVLRVGDSAVSGCVGSWTPNAGGPAVPCACVVEISDAGQDKVSAE